MSDGVKGMLLDEYYYQKYRRAMIEMYKSLNLFEIVVAGDYIFFSKYDAWRGAPALDLRLRFNQLPIEDKYKDLDSIGGVENESRKSTSWG